jgi:predicted dienelactone hydrolase
MHTLHQTESGYMARPGEGRQLVLHFNNLSLRFTPRSLQRLRDQLLALDLSEGMFAPEEKRFELPFETYPITLHFDYYEVHEVLELIEEGLAQHELDQLLTGCGIDCLPLE